MKTKTAIYSVVLAGLLLSLLFNCKKEGEKGTAPIITIATVSNITNIAALCGGDVTSDGGAAVTVRGICWSTNQNPTTSNNKTVDGTGTGSYTSSISGLTPNTTYYLRAYATNCISTSYSNQISFKTPIVKQKVSGLVQKGPYVNGTTISMAELDSAMQQTGKNFTTQITSNNGSFEIGNVTLNSCFVEFSASGYYFDEVKGVLSIAPLNLNALSDITNISSVNVNLLTHLEKSRVAYLINQKQTFSAAKKQTQGEILSIFGFKLSNMDNSETLDISVNKEGNAILLAISIILQGNRSVGDLTELLANISNDISTDGIMSSTGILTDLRNSTLGLDSTSIRSNLVKRYQDLGINATIPNFEKYINMFLAFTGKGPSSTTQPITNILPSSATLNGIVNANSLSTTVSFEYGTSTSYGNVINATPGSITGNSPTNVSAGLTGLLPLAVYHVRVKAVNALGTAYGDDVSFTNPNGVVTLSTDNVSSINTNSAWLGYKITADGGLPITKRGVCYSTTQNPTIDNLRSDDGPGIIGNFTIAVGGLIAGATYYFRAFATNSNGTYYGNQVTATATAILASLTTTDLSAITSTSATGGGNITNDGGATITARGLCWRTLEWPTLIDNKTSDGTGPGNFTSAITGLLPGTTYYFRSYATNSIGTAYGNQVIITTTVSLPSISTFSATSITTTTATLGGNIIIDGGAAVTDRGVCYSTTQNPTITDNKTASGTGTGGFTSAITGLTPGVTYYYRTYATNAIGTIYGSQSSFVTLPLGSSVVTDIDGNVYSTVTIGTQTWMVENLKTTKYRNGDPLDNITGNLAWAVGITGAFCDYGNNSINGSIYGRLYNYQAVNDLRNIAPVGWHIATTADWTTLISYLGGLSVAGSKLKEAGTSHWQMPSDATNETGFTALPGGCRVYYNGDFQGIGVNTYWWSADDFRTYWEYSSNDLKKNSNGQQSYGYSVRCIKD